jgi:hypothetical protein
MAIQLNKFFLMTFGLLVLFASFNSAALTKRSARDNDEELLAEFARRFASNFDDESRDEQVTFSRRNNYGATCRSYSLKGTVLSATCQTEQGNWIPTSINLESIVGNTNGQLTMRRRAMTNQELAEEKRQMQKRAHYTTNFAESCSDIHLSGTTLSSTCKDYSGQEHQTSIDLNNRISNINGQLKID